MKKQRSAELIVWLLGQADVDVREGMSVPDVCRRLRVAQSLTYPERRCLAVESVRQFLKVHRSRPVANGLQPQAAAWRPQVDDPGGVAWCVSG